MNILFSQSFLSEIKSLALRIALSQRNEEHMQDIETLHKKFGREQRELAEEDAKGNQGHMWDELPDVTYYLACMSIVRDELLTHHFVREYDDSRDEQQEFIEFEDSQKNARQYVNEANTWLSAEIEKRNVTVAQLEAGTLAKYRMRASYPKSLIAERTAILNAIK